MKKYAKISLLGAVLLSSLLANSAQAQYERDINNAENRRIQERKALYAENMKKYPYDQHTSGLSIVKDDPGVQNCLRWVSWTPVYHKDRSPYIEHALYDIAIMGDAMINYQSLENKEKMMPQSFFNEFQEKTAKGQKAMDYCSQLSSVPDSYNPRNARGGER